MRAVGVVAMLVVACSSRGGAGTPIAVVATPSQAVASSCQLPVWWAEGPDVHAGFVSVPDGAFTDAGILSVAPWSNQLGGAYGGSYISTKHKWVRAAPPAVSPDGTRYAYWAADPSHSEVHVVDVATGADHLAYSGKTLFVIVSFEANAIYLAHGINVRQGAFEKLYRLDPAGGTPELVPGSDRHMYQWGWVLIADGAAWGIDNRTAGNDYIYSVLRLDLTTSQVTEWVEGPQGEMLWPQGVDGQHRLYAAAYSGPLLRIDVPGQMAELPSPAQVYFGNAIGGPSSFVADSNGVWFSGQGGVWFYSENNAPKEFTVGPANVDVYPAGTCLSKTA